MREQVDRLTKLTADLLDLSKLDADALELRAEAVDLDRLAERVAAEFGPAASATGPSIEVDGDGAAPSRGRPRSGRADHPYPDRQRLTHTRRREPINVTIRAATDGTAS